MTWDAYHRRKSALREILSLADRDRTADADALLDAVPGAREAFPDDLSLLFDVQLAWYQRLSGQLDRAIHAEDDPGLATVSAWVAAAAQMPGARALLDAHLDRPELAKAFGKERALLAASAGAGGYHPAHMDRAGARLFDEARESAVYPEPAPERPARAHDVLKPLVARLRNAIAG